MFAFLRPAPAVPRLPVERIDAEYRRQRRSVFIGIFVGYAAFYLVRKNFALAIPDILKEYPQYSKAALGSAMTGLSIAYGVSKFIMGSVSDRSNPRWFMTLGLLASCAVTFVFGAVPAIYGSVGADHRPADAQRLVQRHGLASVRQGHGALVQHERARSDGGDLECRSQRGWGIGLNRHGPLWIDIASLIAIGFFVSGPIMIIGLHALDLVPKKAAGTAAGFTGFSATSLARRSPARAWAGSPTAGTGAAFSSP